MFPTRKKIRSFPEQEQYWRTKILEDYQPLELCTDFPRPVFQSYIRSREFIELDRETLERFCSNNNTTPEIVMFSALNVLLHRYTNQQERICIGSLSNDCSRFGMDTELFLNAVVLLTSFDRCTTFFDILKAVELTILEAGENRDFPFESLLAILGSNDSDRAPIFQVLFLIPGQEEHATFSHIAVRCDLVFAMQDASDTVKLHCDYDAELFESTTIQRMLSHFQNLFMAATSRPDGEFTKFPMLTEQEIHQLTEWNETTADYPRNLSISRVFEMQEESSPDAIALSSDQGELTYKELNTRANQAAHYLISQGMKMETPIAIFMERSIEMIISMLGILKAGCAYVPLDPDYPQERIAFILKDCGAPVVLTQQRLLKRLGTSTKTICIDASAHEICRQDSENPSVPTHAKNLGYIMYTSGSTGNPKGVCVEHRGVVRVAKATNYADISPDDVFLQIVSYCFDASCTEIWGTLMNGARLVLFPHQKPTVAELEKEIHRWGLTAVYLTTGLFDRFIECNPHNLGTIRKLFTGGDVLSVRNANRAIELMNGGTLFNDYGPTECTELSTVYKLSAPHYSGSIPIGRPLSNTSIYILDRFLQPVPIGVPGEIFIGGDGVARGYLNRPELTKARFLRNPFSTDPEARLYRSGDMGRWRNDGNIEFFGRIDNQVKIRGYRIELEEIQHVLRQNEEVQDCVVLAIRESETDKCLVAYVLLNKASSATRATLRSFLRSKLPDYMIPSYFVFVDSFLLTTNGKIDKKALEALSFRKPEATKISAAPRTELEATIAQIWSEVLALQTIGIDDNFLELGGHSLSAMQILSRISSIFHLEMSIQTLFDSPTVATFSASIASRLNSLSSEEKEIV